MRDFSISGNGLSYPNLYNQFLDHISTDHWRVYIFRIENGKLATFKVKAHIRCIGVKNNVLLFVKLTFRLFAIAAWFPGNGFVATDAQLYIDVFVVAFKFAVSNIGSN